MNFNLNNDYEGYISRYVTSVQKNAYKKTEELKIIKTSIYKIKKNIKGYFR